MLMTYLQSFTPAVGVDYLLLPGEPVTARPSAPSRANRHPSPLFPSLWDPALGQDHPFRPLGWIALLRFAAWTLGTQQTRSSCHSIRCSACSPAVIEPGQRVRAAAVNSRLRASSLDGRRHAGVSADLPRSTLPIGVVFGASPDASRLSVSTSAVRFIRDELEENDQVFMAGWWATTAMSAVFRMEQSQWTQLVVSRTQQAVTGSEPRYHPHLLVDMEGWRSCCNDPTTPIHCAFPTEYAPSAGPAPNREVDFSRLACRVNGSHTPEDGLA
jgi:hypothetical protein